MGGAKKPTVAKVDKSAGGGGSKDSKKGKKADGTSGPKKAEITVMVNEQQAMKIIKSAKVITVQELARQMGVKTSATNKFLRDQTDKGVTRTVGGYSGHRLYQMVPPEPVTQAPEAPSEPAAPAPEPATPAPAPAATPSEPAPTPAPEAPSPPSS